MKRPIYGLTSLLLCFLLLTSCSEDKIAIPAQKSQENLNANILSRYVDGNWSSSAQLRTSLPNQSDTYFMLNQMGDNAALWGQQTPTLRFVEDTYQPNSTYNAISYSTGKIYYGYAIFADAKSRSADNIVNVMILAHEYGHQLQYAYNLPSVQESTARPNELEADGFAGFYLRVPDGFNKSSFYDIAVAYEFAAEIGDYSTNSPGHHGTPPQRRSAVRLGFLIGNALLNSNLTSFTPVDFDNTFFYYYSGVLQGSYSDHTTDPVEKAVNQGIPRSIAEYMTPYITEIQNIKTGVISAKEWQQLD